MKNQTEESRVKFRIANKGSILRTLKKDAQATGNLSGSAYDLAKPSGLEK